MTSTLWNQQQEQKFFIQLLKSVKPEQLFYTTQNNQYVAYWLKNYEGTKTTLQSRNSFIGSYTEQYVAQLFSRIAMQVNGYAIQNVVCESIGLTKKSTADVAICKTNNTVQKPEDILMIVEVKMSVVWNWEFIPTNEQVICIGDYTTHKGTPGLLRSDSMLKAIGKSINIRISHKNASQIPIIVVGNTPITKTYYQKVDHLKKNGIIQGFLSLNSQPTENTKDNIKSTPEKGFYRVDTYQELQNYIIQVLKQDAQFFYSAQSPKRLGEIIEVSNQEHTYEAKAQKFLELLQDK